MPKSHWQRRAGGQRRGVPTRDDSPPPAAFRATDSVTCRLSVAFLARGGPVRAGFALLARPVPCAAADSDREQAGGVRTDGLTVSAQRWLSRGVVGQRRQQQQQRCCCAAVQPAAHRRAAGVRPLPATHAVMRRTIASGKGEGSRWRAGLFQLPVIRAELSHRHCSLGTLQPAAHAEQWRAVTTRTCHRAATTTLPVLPAPAATRLHGARSAGRAAPTHE